jgi:WD40 repeat protein
MMGLVPLVSFSPDGLSIVSWSWDITVRVWDVEQRMNVWFDLPSFTIL